MKKCVMILAGFLAVLFAGAALAASTTGTTTPLKAQPSAIKMAPRTVPATTDRPDLTVGSITFPSGTHPTAGDTMRVVVMVWNNGKVASTNAAITLILRPGPANQPTPPGYSKNLPLPSVAPQKAVAIQDDIVLPNFAPGGWVAEVKIDPQNKIAESNEQNNIGSQNFNVY